MFRKKFPHCHQPDPSRSSDACLHMVCKHFDVEYSSNDQFQKDESFIDLAARAEKIGFRVQQIKIDFDDLKGALMPCIIPWKEEGTVVVYKVSSRSVHISDPVLGLVKLMKRDFIESWNNTGKQWALFLSVTPGMYVRKNQVGKAIGLTFLYTYLQPYRKLIFQLFIGFVTGSVLSLIFPFLTQAIVDIGIVTHDVDFIVLILIAQLVLIISQAFIEFIRNWIMLHISVRVSIFIISDFLVKLMKLPIGFFDQRLVGDIRQRIEDNVRIQNFLTNNLISMSFGLLTFLIYSVVMAIYDIKILAIFYLGSLAYILWIVLFLKQRRVLDFKQYEESVKDQNKIFEMVTGMQEIKLNAWEKYKRMEWEGIQTRLFKISVKGLALNQYQHIGSILINQTQNIFISFLAAKSVLNGNITLGMMVALQYIVGQLNRPIGELISFIGAAQDTSLSLKRLEEIHAMEDEVGNVPKGFTELPANQTLSINDMSYGYGDRLLFEQINLEIPDKKVTAIVGASGSGKTTLLKLLLGFYAPQKGTIQIGNISLSDVNIDFWRSKCGAVMQDGVIFSDSIKNNIALGSSPFEIEKFQFAVHIGNLEDLINDLPLGIDSLVGQDGIGLSQGQKQRILIARAVYRNPDFLFFDEATNSLDANNEKAIVERLGNFYSGKTVVVIAHRLSTVMAADQIVVLNHGKIVEKGTHEELVERRGHYFLLVKNQLEMAI
jgi:ATP-binding cassette subfamily B protein